MAERRAAVAGWVWALGSVVPLGGAFATVLLLQGSDAVWAVLSVAATLAVAGLIAVPVSSGSEFTPAYIVVAALPLLVANDGAPLLGREEEFAVVATGLALLWLIRTARGDDQRQVLTTILRRAFAFGTYLSVFVAMAPLVPDGEGAAEWGAFIQFLPAAAAAFAVEVVLGAAVRLGPGAGKRRYLAYLILHDFDVFMALTATGALFGLAYQAIGWWAIAVAALPYLFTHGAFRRLAAARTTYSQTMRALAQIPEVGGHTHAGHAARTASLATAVATELGLRPSEVDEIEMAALMHDIGRVTLNEPNILRMGYTDSDLSAWGAEIVGEAAYLSGVAEIIRRQPEPYRNPGEVRDPAVPLASRIVKVTSAYDEATSELGYSSLEAIERLHQGSVYEFDPDVVAALRRTLERRGVFAHPAR